MPIATLSLDGDVQAVFLSTARVYAKLTEQVSARLAKQLTICGFKQVVKIDHGRYAR
jgi:hypothetical protein